MTKAFFYETEGGTLHRCMFAGLDSEGEPQWLLMDTLCCYFDALEQDYGIRLHKTITSDNVDLAELDVEDKLMFDKIISSEL